MSGQFEIDDIVLVPQPDDHVWETKPETTLEYDGAGAPIRRKYRKCTLIYSRTTDYANWAQFDDSATHTVSCPAPGDRASAWDDYASVYVEVAQGRVRGVAAIDGLEMTFYATV